MRRASALAVAAYCQQRPAWDDPPRRNERTEMHATLHLLRQTDFPDLARRPLETLQVNLGYRCNQSCVHCHVNAGPTRTEMMSAEVIGTVVDFLAAGGARALDITGGAPEMHPLFRELVQRARALGVHVMDRCNLTILSEPGQEDLARFLADHQVEIVASLPCYTEELVDRQRGAGVYEASIRGMRMLNALGYGAPGSGLALNLVYNPQGPVLPPAQEKLEADYKRILGERSGVVFNGLYTLANMPIQRFGSMLVSKGQFGEYMRLLRTSHRDENVDGVMCRTLLSVDWLGHVYDCDFNQMLGIPMWVEGKPRARLADLVGRDLAGNPIAVADHCYGCTAGQGSSCGGALG
jgi:radical SAM/Cys-rich protein